MLPLVAAASAALFVIGGGPSGHESSYSLSLKRRRSRCHMTCSRRQYLSATAGASVTASSSLVFWSSFPSLGRSLVPADDEGIQVDLPLEATPGGTCSVRITLMGKETILGAGRKKYNGGQGIQGVPYQVIRMVVDTGSPYLVVADGASGGGNSCVIASGFIPAGDAASYQNNLYDALLSSFSEDDDEDAINNSFEFEPSEYLPTEEIYGSQAGQTAWKSTSAKFRDPRLVSASPSGRVILGVLDEALVAESGGPLLGLVKRSNAISTKIQRRPTFLEQIMIASPDDPAKLSEVASFRLNYPNKSLTLSTQPMLSSADRNIPTSTSFNLIDLRPLGDFVEHYACLVEEVVFDGVAYNSQTLASREGAKRKGTGRRKKRDIVAVFDSGLSGCLLIKPFYDRLVEGEGLDPSKFSSVEVRIKPCAGERGGNKKKSSSKRSSTKGESFDAPLCTISSSKDSNRLFYVDPISLDWFDDEETAPFVIVLGQTFLSQGCLTVDIDDRRAAFHTCVADELLD